MIRILCYGDSNTWGFIPGTVRQRYNENERWTKLLSKLLGDNFEIIEEGLNSRTLCSEYVGQENKIGKNGFTYLKPCMETHDKIDLVILMLGTNELKAEFNHTAKEIVDMFDKYVNFIKHKKSVIDGSIPKLIISGVPLVMETSLLYAKSEKYRGAGSKSVELNQELKDYCTKNNIIYIDNMDLTPGADGVHLSKEAHKNLANKLKDVLLSLTF